MHKIDIFKTQNGKEPYIDWFERLDITTRARINTRLTRIRETGNYGDCEPIGEGVYELRYHFGPGYRVYFGYEEETLILLLIGGDKKTQKIDVKKAKEYWKEHLLLKGDKNEKIQKL